VALTFLFVVYAGFCSDVLKQWWQWICWHVDSHIMQYNVEIRSHKSPFNHSCKNSDKNQTYREHNQMEEFLTLRRHNKTAKTHLSSNYLKTGYWPSVT